MKHLDKIIGLLLFCLSLQGQSTHLKIALHDKKTRETIPNQQYTVTLNDTLTKVLTTDNDGLSKPIIIQDYVKWYKVKISVDGYETKTFKKVGINGARGRHFDACLDPIKK